MKLECVVFGMVVAAGWPEQLVALKQQRQVQDDRANWTDEDQPVTTDGKNTMKHQIRYYGTTDSAIEVDAMAQVLRKISKKQNVHIASVIGGLSCLNLFVGLEYKHVTATFYDYVPGTTGLAKMYIELIKLAKTRQEFLEMFYARRLHPSDFPVTTWNQRSTFYDRPCDTAFADSVAALLVSDGAHKIYMRELLPLVGCARKSGALHPKTWPVYTKDMRPDKHVEMSNLALTGSTHTDILKNATDKVTTLWFGQAGFLKNDGNFQQAKNAIQRATFQFHTLSIAADDLSVLAVPKSNPGAEVFVFTSNALTVRRWVPDGRNKTAVAKRFKTAFPHATVIETACWAGTEAMRLASSSNVSKALKIWKF